MRVICTNVYPTPVELAPRDDIESLALVALFLLRGNLPWKPRPRLECPLYSQEIVRLMKCSCSGPILSYSFPNEFGELLTDSRSLNFDQLPDYASVRRSLARLAERMGHISDSGPLDWTPFHPQIPTFILDVPEVSIPDEREGEGIGKGEDNVIHLGEDSYYGMDLDSWKRHGERDKDVTLPAQQETELDNITPVIVEVEDN